MFYLEESDDELNIVSKNGEKYLWNFTNLIKRN